MIFCNDNDEALYSESEDFSQGFGRQLRNLTWATGLLGYMADDMFHVVVTDITLLPKVNCRP